MDRDILVDGYNVIKNNLMFQTLVGKNFAYARELLIRQLKNRYRHTVQRVTVVFDGDGDREQVTHDEHVRIIFSRYDESADSVIARLAAEAQQAGRLVEMYSDDEEVRTSVAEKGGGVKSTNHLTRSLTSAPHDMAARSLYRQEMRRVYGIDPLAKHKDDEEEQPLPKKRGRKKKKKSSRHYR
jgi:predicted RNA-binding protein with PIN domain